MAEPPGQLAFADRTIPALLDRQAARHGDRELVRAPGGTRTYAALRDAVAGRAGRLRAAGVGPGDRVAFLCANGLDLLESMLACAWCGAVAAPLNTALRGDGLRHALAVGEPRLVVADDDLRGWIESVGANAELVAPGALAPAEPVAPHAVGPGDGATILFTSGTTGPAKGVLGPHAQVITFAQAICELLRIDGDDVLHTCLPLFHVNAWSAFFQALLRGARYSLVPRFSASRFWAEAVDAGATVLYLIGGMIPMLLRRPAGPLDRAHRVRTVNGMAPPAELAAAARERFGLEVVECYASTECGCALGAPIGAQRPGWMGRAMPGYEVRVVDADDEELPAGEPGELIVRSSVPFALFAGYFAMPEATVRAWRNLWFHTGDRVVADEDGWVRFLDRMGDAIRRRGENISSFEVESAVSAHPAVSEVAVFPVASDLGEEDDVMAAVVVRDGRRLEPLDLVRWCEGRLAYFAIPRYVELVDALPRTPNGKVRKVTLRERGVGADTWDLERSGYRPARPVR
jgi:crotonobetaine/carnitine-CoA ligase